MIQPKIAPTRTWMDGPNRMIRERAGARTVIEIDGGKIMNWATTPRISQDFLDLCAYQRSVAPTRARIGDWHGGFQKVAEIPASYLYGKVPPDAWEDRKAIAAIVNDRDLCKLRTDNGRTF